jgi:hypothetical protein
MKKFVKESCKKGFELLQVRSRVFNLKGNKLRENVLCGVILPEKFATMTAEEMASDQVN